MAAPDEGPTTLYRVYGPKNELLYIGITNDIDARMDQHFISAGVRDAHNLSYAVTEYPSRDEAHRVERWAITVEEPVLNRLRYASWIVDGHDADPTHPHYPYIVEARAMLRAMKVLDGPRAVCDPEPDWHSIPGFTATWGAYWARMALPKRERRRLAEAEKR